LQRQSATTSSASCSTQRSASPSIPFLQSKRKKKHAIEPASSEFSTTPAAGLEIALKASSPLPGKRENMYKGKERLRVVPFMRFLLLFFVSLLLASCQSNQAIVNGID